MEAAAAPRRNVPRAAGALGAEQTRQQVCKSISVLPPSIGSAALPTVGALLELSGDGSLQHNLANAGVYVALSTIPSGGSGLFALRAMAADTLLGHVWGKLVPNHVWSSMYSSEFDHIDETHIEGEEDYAQWAKRGVLRGVGWPSITEYDTLIVSQECAAAYINHSDDEKKRNVQFDIGDADEMTKQLASSERYRSIPVRTTRAVEQGEELLIDYKWNSQVWQVARDNAREFAEQQQCRPPAASPTDMTDSSELYRSGQWQQLRERLQTDGFLFVRNVLPREDVQAARTRMLLHLRSLHLLQTSTADASLEPGAEMATGVKTGSTGWTIVAETGERNDPQHGAQLDKTTREQQRQAWLRVGTSAELLNVYRADKLSEFYANLFGQGQFTPLSHCTWVRAKGPKLDTPTHSDFGHFLKESTVFQNYYSPTQSHVKRPGQNEYCCCAAGHEDEKRSGKQSSAASRAPPPSCSLCQGLFHVQCVQASEKYRGGNKQLFCPTCLNAPIDMWTCWIPLSDLSGKQSRLEILPRSHRDISGYEAPLHIGGDYNLLPSGGGKIAKLKEWQRPSSVAMGDLILFNFKTVHRANKHMDTTFRLSLDTRVTTCHRSPIAQQQAPEWHAALLKLAQIATTPHT